MDRGVPPRYPIQCPSFTSLRLVGVGGQVEMVIIVVYKNRKGVGLKIKSQLSLRTSLSSL